LRAVFSPAEFFITALTKGAASEQLRRMRQSLEPALDILDGAIGSSRRSTNVFIDTKPPSAAKHVHAASASKLTRRRHVAIYLPALIGGGAERVAAILATKLSAAGHHVTLVVDFEALQNEGFVGPGVERVTLAGAHGSDVIRLADFLPEIVLAIGAATNIKLVAAHLLAKLTGGTSTRVVLSYHGPSSHGTGWLGWLGYPLASLLTRYASRTICVSDDLVRHLVQDWRAAAKRIVRIYNPITIERAQLAADATALASRPPRVIAVGRLVAQKDFATLIAAMALLPRTDARLAIYGEGPEQPALSRLAERLGVAGRIDWCGYVNEPWNAYASGRCFVLSSQNDAFGNVVVEALASGLPVVSTACGETDASGQDFAVIGQSPDRGGTRSVPCRCFVAGFARGARLARRRPSDS
jgi:glycosyltransferase involved in cell wall biosynthesis